MPINPVTGYPYGSTADKELRDRFDEATRDAPWWTWLVGLLLIPIFWAAFFAVSGLLKLVFHLVGLLLAVPVGDADLLSFVCALLLVLAGGVVCYVSKIRRTWWFSVAESGVGVLSAAFAAISLPEGGTEAIAAVIGGMLGVADGLRRMYDHGKGLGTPPSPDSKEAEGSIETDPPAQDDLGIEIDDRPKERPHGG